MYSFHVGELARAFFEVEGKESFNPRNAAYQHLNVLYLPWSIVHNIRRVSQMLLLMARVPSERGVEKMASHSLMECNRGFTTFMKPQS